MMLTLSLLAIMFILLLLDEAYRRQVGPAVFQVVGGRLFGGRKRSLAVYETLTLCWLVSGLFDLSVIYADDPQLQVILFMNCLFAAAVVAAVAIWQDVRFSPTEAERVLQHLGNRLKSFCHDL